MQWRVLVLAVAATTILPLTAGAQQAAPAWSYAGATGPAQWGALAPAWNACATGARQSPINIAGRAPNAGALLAHDHNAAPATLRNTGHTIQADVAGGGSVRVDSGTYGLVQLHFHAPSEHTVNGANAPLEMHLVHRDSAGRLAVIGVLFREGAANAAYAPLLSGLPARAGESRQLAQLDVPALLPATLDHWRYEGSLTTPPCAEGVRWIVLSTPVTISAEQVRAFTALYAGSNRPVQPMGARTFLP